MRSFKILCWCLCFLSPLSAGTLKVQSLSGRSYEALPNQVLVKYKANSASAAKSRHLKNYGIKMANLPRLEVVSLSVPTGYTLESFLHMLERDPDVEYAEPNGVLKAFLVPNDPDYTDQYALPSTHINAEGAWDITLGDSNLIVAVIDTGISLTHTDLDGSLWTNPAPSGTSGLHGTRMEINWNDDADCTDNDLDLGPEQCASNNPTDDNASNSIYHGTRVSGIIGAEFNNSQDMAGIASGCKIMAVKVLNSEGNGSFSSIAAGIRYAVDNGASVINLSLGGGGTSNTVLEQLEYAFEHNVVVIAASGNDGNATAVSFPANVARVIAVGATDAAKNLAFFSCTGNAMDVVAPGVDILSTIPTNTTTLTNGDGTSFSAPMVSAVAALIRSVYPSATIQEVTNYINFTATDLGAGGFDKNFGFGLLNAKAAVEAAQNRTSVSSTAGPESTFSYPNPFRLSQSATVTFTTPVKIGAEGVKIEIMNVAGEIVKTISNSNTWDGKDDQGKTVASGLYFYNVDSPQGSSKGKVTVIK